MLKIGKLWGVEERGLIQNRHLCGVAMLRKLDTSRTLGESTFLLIIVRVNKKLTPNITFSRFTALTPRSLTTSSATLAVEWVTLLPSAPPFVSGKAPHRSIEITESEELMILPFPKIVLSPATAPSATAANNSDTSLDRAPTLLPPLVPTVKLPLFPLRSKEELLPLLELPPLP